MASGSVHTNLQMTAEDPWPENSPIQVPPTITRLIGKEGYVWLYRRAQWMRSAVDVGCWYGASTYVLCSALRGPVYAVDHWLGSPEVGDATHHPPEGVYETFLKNVGHFTNLTIYRMPSVEAAAKFANRSVDLVCIDAGHDTESVTADFRAWLPKTRAFFCGHDRSHGPVRAALQDLCLPIEEGPADMWGIRLCDG